MTSVNLYNKRKEYPDKSDEEIAQLLAQEYGYVAIVRYKSDPSGDYNNFGCCSSVEKLEGYKNSPYCHDTEIIYDIRKQSLLVTEDLIRNAQCDMCKRSTTEASLTLMAGDDYYACSCGLFFCDDCYMQLPLTNPAGGYGMCPQCRKEVKRAVVGTYIS